MTGSGLRCLTCVQAADRSIYEDRTVTAPSPPDAATPSANPPLAEPAEPPNSRSDAVRTAPAARLSSRALSVLLLLTCLIPLVALSGYAALFGKARDAPLEVEVSVVKEPVEVVGGQAAILTDAIVIQNLTDYELPNLTIDLNGQYFLHRQSALAPRERLVFPQQIFATKSNQRWVPGRYPITKISVTAKLPSGRRGVKIVRPQAAVGES